jgi:hypothetical protein
MTQRAQTGSLSSPRRWGRQNKEDTPPTRVEAKDAEDDPGRKKEKERRRGG